MMQTFYSEEDAAFNSELLSLPSNLWSALGRVMSNSAHGEYVRAARRARVRSVCVSHP